MNRFFIARLGSLLLVVGALFFYQGQALDWQAAKQENQEKIQEVNAYNKKILAAQSEEKQKYKDGTYEGQGEGFGGTIKVSIEIKQDIMEKITILQADGEDAAYLSMAEEMLDSMVEAQTAQVDTISGATYSSMGIKTAVEDALSQASTSDK